MSSRVTLRQIAEKAGCSRSAVSYALKNHPSISKEKRAEIMKIAEEMGWRPNAELARQMSLVRSTVMKTDLPQLAIVINRPKEIMEGEWEFAPVEQLKGAARYAEKMGYGYDVFNLAEDPLSPKRLKNILIARGIEGIVFCCTVDPELPVEYLEIGKDFACACSGIRSSAVPYHAVLSDFLSGGRMIIKKIMEAGYRRPAILMPRGLDEQLGYAFTGGVSSGMLDLALEDRLPIQHLGRTECFIPEYEFDRVKQWMLRNRPDALVSTDVEHGLELIKELKEEGLDLSLYCLDWFPTFKDVAGGINFRHHEIGRAAVDLVVAQLHTGRKGLPNVQRCVIVEGIWSDESKDPLL